jgi:pyridinium-3,5-bisthiocarboxylic acid mononucleotide nickel chelatase
MMQQEQPQTKLDGRHVIYFDPCAGAAGDMINAALIDAGADLAAIQAGITSLGIAGLSVRVEHVQKGAVGALHFVVESNPAATPDHLGPDEIIDILDRADVAASVRARAIAIVERIAAAEAHVHRVDRQQVHFHELGGLDTVVDVLGALIALDSLKIEACFTGPLPSNGGTWGMQHGPMPLPSPATLEIIARAGLAVVAAPEVIPQGKELVTPTGAAILAEMARPGLPAMRLDSIGYGAGTRDLPVPNILRAWVGTLI